MLQRIGDLEIEQDLGYERRAWVVRRVFTILFSLVLVAALLGLFGTGPLSKGTAQAGGLSVHFQRFVRHQAPQTLEVDLPNAGGRGSIGLSSDLLEGAQAQAVTPEPDSSTATSDRVLYTWSESPPRQISFDLQTTKTVGTIPVTVWGPRGERVSFTQVVYP
jgi:preprotein translocase subunit SecF